MEKAKILIAIPNLGSINPRLVMRLLRWSTVPTSGVGQVSVFLPQGQIPHDSARNFCVNQLLNNTDATHLFFIDDDVVPDDDALEKLVTADKDIITGLYPSMRQVPRTKEVIKIFNAFRYGQTEDGDYGLIPVMSGEGGVVPVERAGGGCLLIKRHVFETMQERPWFKFQYNADGTLHFGEDIDFCAKATRAGFEIFAHLDVKCGHIKEMTL